MRPTYILSVYFGRQFLAGLGIVLALLAGVVFLFELAELMRRAANRDEVGLLLIVEMSLLHLPLLILAAFSVNRSRFTVWEGFSLDWYRAMFANRDLMESAGNSLMIAIGSTVLLVNSSMPPPVRAKSFGDT